jgi:hypothetical protein
VHSLFPLLHLSKGNRPRRRLPRTHLVTEILEDVAIKLLSIINCYLPRHPEVAYYVLLEKSFKPHYYYVD